MTNVTILQLPSATSASGADIVPFVQSGITKKITLNNFFVNRDIVNPVLSTPTLGTPISGTLTNCVGLPINTGVSGLASNIATFLTTPSSANFLAALTDKTGTGVVVFGTAPTITNSSITNPTITSSGTGSINSTPIGNSSASTGKFTTLAINIVTNVNATYTVLTTDHTIIQTTVGSTYTLPDATTSTGRQLHIVTQFAGAVISASSNVVPIAGGAAGTAILAATAGKYAILQSNGTNWIIVASN